MRQVEGAGNPGKSRRDDLDRAKGLGILLVVFGHIVARDPPGGNDWYVQLKYAVYQFHMPFFMYLSGYVTFLSGVAYTKSSAWLSFAAKRAERLLLPFLLFGLMIIAGKLLAARFFYVDNLPASVPLALAGLLWNTDTSPATSVWYIAVLFVLCVLTPPLLRALGASPSRLVAVTAVLYLLPVPHVLYLDRVGTYFLFFALGGLAATHGERWLRFTERWAWWWLAALLAVSGVILMAWVDVLPDKLKLLIAGIISMPALHGAILRTASRGLRLLSVLGTYSFVIYLLNTVFIGLVKGIMLGFFDWNGPRFLIYAPTLLLAGLAGPLLLKRYVPQARPSPRQVDQLSVAAIDHRSGTQPWIRDTRWSWLVALLVAILIALIIPPDLKRVAAINVQDLGAPNPLLRTIKLAILAVALLLLARRWQLLLLLLRSTNPYLLAFMVLMPASLAWSIAPTHTISRYTYFFTIVSACFAFALTGWHRERFQNVLRVILTLFLGGSLLAGAIDPRMVLEVGDTVSLKGAWHGLASQKNEFGQMASFGVILWVHALITGSGRRLFELCGPGHSRRLPDVVRGARPA